MANAWPRWRGAAAEPRIWLILLGGMCLTPRSRGSGATVWEALEPVVRRRIRSPEDTCVCPEGQGARTQKCPAVAQSCRVSGRRPRVSETCDRSSLETRINYSLHRLFTSPTAADGVDRQRVTVRGSGFGVRGVAARRRGGPGPIHGREVLVVTSRTSKNAMRRPARAARRHLRGRYRGISYPDISHSTRPRADETARTGGCRL